MAEYIERTEALEITTRTCGDYAAAWSEIRKLPAADVAPVVRCRNCANFRQNAHGVCYCNEYGGAITPEDYCSRAVRKNEPTAK
jgi:hypothetical protein